MVQLLTNRNYDRDLGQFLHFIDQISVRPSPLGHTGFLIDTGFVCQSCFTPDARDKQHLNDSIQYEP